MHVSQKSRSRSDFRYSRIQGLKLDDQVSLCLNRWVCFPLYCLYSQAGFPCVGLMADSQQFGECRSKGQVWVVLSASPAHPCSDVCPGGTR